MNLAGIGSSIAGWTSGANWYKWGAILVVLVALLVASYKTGEHKAELRCEEAKTALAEARTAAVIDFTNVQGKAATVADKAADKVKEEVFAAKAELERETSTRQELVACNISVTRLKQLNAIAAATRSR